MEDPRSVSKFIAIVIAGLLLTVAAAYIFFITHG
jgi:hypothetical protein